MHMLCRHSTSGAIKTVWQGDIVPQKQLPIEWKNWPFYIECKSGYSNQTCTLNNQNIVRLWIDKCIKDLGEHQSKIILLLVNFKSYSTLLITEFKLNNIEPMLILIHNSRYYRIYEFKEVVKLDFLESFGWKINE
jgi:hypothetical protein